MVYSKILVLTALTLSMPQQSWSQKSGASAQKADLIVVGKGSRPRWSPDSKRLAYLSAGKVYLYDIVADSSFSIGPALSVKYEWYDNDNLVFSHDALTGQNKGSFIVTTMSLDGTTREIHSSPASSQRPGWTLPIQLLRSTKGPMRVLDLGTESVHAISLSPRSERNSSESLSEGEFFVIANRHAQLYRMWRQESDNDIWLINAAGDPIRRIARAKGGERLISPKLSSNGKMAMFSDGWGLLVYSITGDSLGGLHPASSGKWIAGSNKFVYAKIEENGLDVTASDIFVTDSSCTSVTQLTNTPEKIELYPTVSPDGSRLAYSDYSTGDLEIVIVLREVISE